jgi:hypothetical protein
METTVCEATETGRKKRKKQYDIMSFIRSLATAGNN